MRLLRLIPGLLSSSILVGAVLASAPAAHAADVPVSEQARTHFAAGVALLQDPHAPRYEEAYREFKAAYAASPSYKILGNLGLCAMKIERDAEAVNAYESYLKEAGPALTVAEREQIQRDLLTLKTGLVTVTVSSDPPGAIIQDVRVPVEGPEVRNSYGEALTPLSLGLRRGHHVITARLAGYVDQKWEFEATGTTLPPHVFKLSKPAPTQLSMVRERPITTAAYVSGGITLALALTGGYFGLAALQKQRDFTALNDGTHVAEAQAARSSGQTLNLVADSFFAGALVGFAVTSYLVVSRPTVERPIGLLPRRFGPTWARGGGGASAEWAF